MTKTRRLVLAGWRIPKDSTLTPLINLKKDSEISGAKNKIRDYDWRLRYGFNWRDSA